MLAEIIANRRAALTSAQLASMLRADGGSDAGVSVNATTAMRVAAVWACVRVLSETLAQLPLIVYRREGKNKVRATDSKLYYLLHDAPNSYQTSYEFRETMQSNRVLRGCGYAYINRSLTGEILELLPLSFDKVEVKQKKDWTLEYTFTDSDNNKHVYPQEKVFRVPGMTFNGVDTLSPIEYHRQSIGLAIASDKHRALSYKNGGKFWGYLTHPGKLSEAAIKNLRESFDANFGGSNSFKTPVFTEGAAWTAASMTPKDLQYIESQKFQIEDIARIFRVPPHKIGHLERATFSNIEHQGLEFVVDTMMPHVRVWEQSISRSLLLPGERAIYSAEFLLEGLLRGDSAARASFYSTMLDRAVMSPNEVRERENWNPYDGGDVYQRAGNLTNTGGSNNQEKPK